MEGAEALGVYGFLLVASSPISVHSIRDLIPCLLSFVYTIFGHTFLPFSCVP